MPDPMAELLTEQSGAFGRGEVVLLVQMGKVGSETIEATLQACLPGRFVCRTHFISAERQAERTRLVTEMEAGGRPPLPIMRREIEEAARLLAILESPQLRRDLEARKLKLDVITGVREPVGHRLSAIFQNHIVNFTGLDDVSLAKCRELMCRRLLDDRDWFDRETRAVFGIDAYSQAFPHDRGYAVLENEFARVLIYRFENLDRLPVMLSEFLGIPPPPVINRNIGAGKEYSRIYDDIKRRLTLPEELLDRVYGRKMARHFYTDEERAQFRRRWCNEGV